MSPKLSGKKKSHAARANVANNPLGYLGPREFTTTLKYRTAVPNSGGPRWLDRASETPSDSSWSTPDRSPSPRTGEFGILTGDTYSRIASSAGRSRRTPPAFAGVAISPGFGSRQPLSAQPLTNVFNQTAKRGQRSEITEPVAPAPPSQFPPIQQSTYGMPTGYHPRYGMANPPQNPYAQQSRPPTTQSGYGPPNRPPVMLPTFQPTPFSGQQPQPTPQGQGRGRGSTEPANYVMRQPAGQGQQPYGYPNPYGRGQTPYGGGW